MKPTPKIATCCYCGKRSLLKLSARDGHELACGSCGAPLHEMKWLKAPEQTPKPKPAAQPNFSNFAKAPRVKQGKSRKKKRKTIWNRVVEDLWDEIEDIFD